MHVYQDNLDYFTCINYDLNRIELQIMLVNCNETA